MKDFNLLRSAALYAAFALCAGPSLAAPKLLLCDWSRMSNVPQKVELEIRVDEENNTVEYGQKRQPMEQVFITPRLFVFLNKENKGWSIDRMSGDFSSVELPPGGKPFGMQIGVCKSIEERKF